MNFTDSITAPNICLLLFFRKGSVLQRPKWYPDLHVCPVVPGCRSTSETPRVICFFAFRPSFSGDSHTPYFTGAVRGVLGEQSSRKLQLVNNDEHFRHGRVRGLQRNTEGNQAVSPEDQLTSLSGGIPILCLFVCAPELSPWLSLEVRRDIF